MPLFWIVLQIRNELNGKMPSIKPTVWTSWRFLSQFMSKHFITWFTCFLFAGTKILWKFQCDSHRHNNSKQPTMPPQVWQLRRSCCAWYESLIARRQSKYRWNPPAELQRRVNS
jgi:hypothetical protein